MQCHGSDYLLYLSRSWKAEWLSGHYGIRPPHSAQCSVLHLYPTSLLHSTSRRITTNVHFHESLSKLNWLITRTKTKVSWDPYLLELEEPLWTPKSTLCAQTSQNKPKTKVCFRPGCFINIAKCRNMNRETCWVKDATVLIFMMVVVKRIFGLA